MSNILFYFGATILTLIILIMTSATPTYYHDKIQNATTTITTTMFTNVFAQEDEEEEEEEEDKDSKDEEKDNEDKDKEEEESEDKDSKDEEKEEESEEQQNETAEQTESEQITQTELNELIANNIQQQLDQPILNLTNDHILNNTNTVVEEEEEQQQPTLEESSIVLEPPIVTSTTGKPFNATCNCFATNVPAPSPPTPTPTPEEPQIELIPITNANIDNSQSSGQITNPAYTSFYTVSNLIDNTTDQYSYWSQAGPSSFYIELDNIMDNYQVCSAELTNINKPNNAPYLLDIGVSKNYSGVIDQTTEKIQFDKCVKNMDEILMIFDSPPRSYLSIGEMKLFGKKLGNDSQPPPQQPTQPQPPVQPDPTIPQPQPAPYHQQNNNATKINIENSTAEVDIKNSTITFKFDPQSAQATNYNVITIPNTEVVK